MSIPYYTVSSLSKLFRDIVTLIHNEILVEHLENFAALKVCHFVAAYCNAALWKKGRVQQTMQPILKMRKLANHYAVAENTAW